MQETDRSQLLPRPPNPKDILRSDPADAVPAAQSGIFTDMVNVLKINGTSYGLVVDVAGNIDAAYDTGHTGKLGFSPSDIALDRSEAARQRGNFLMSARSTFLSLDLQSPAETMPLQLYSEADFIETPFDSDVHSLAAFRHFFGRIGAQELHLAAGQTWTVFGDQDARPRSLNLDHAPAGCVYLRKLLQLQIGGEVVKGLDVAAAIEEPLTDDFFLVNQTDVRLRRWPTIVGRLRYEYVPSLDFAQVAVLGRGIGLEDTNFREQSDLGWGVSLIASKTVWSRDRIQMGVVTGEGLGDYLYGLGSRTAAGGPFNGQLQAIENTGAYVGYVRRWSDALWSHAAYGYAFADTTANLPDATRKLQNAWVNLIWQPFKQLALGLEYDYGVHEVTNGTIGENHRVQLTVSAGASSGGAPMQGRL